MLVNAATRSITPIDPCALAASGSAGDFLRVESGLEANALLIRGDDGPIVLVSLDLLTTGGVATQVRSDLGTSMSSDRLVIAASHTHNGPATDPLRPGLGLASPDYIGLVTRVVSELVTGLLAERHAQPAVVGIGAGTAFHSINRRRPRLVSYPRHLEWHTTIMAPNPAGPVDETLTCAVFRSREGRPLAVVWNYACHPTSHPEPDVVSSHYPGVVREALRRELGDATLPVIFLQGFSGNTRPKAPSVLRPSVRGLKRLAIGPGFSRFSAEEYRAWSTSLAAQVVAAATSARHAAGAPLAWVSKPVPAVELFRGGSSADVHFRGVRVGELLVVSVEAEPVVEHGLLLRRELRSTPLMPVGCEGDVAGYLPTDQMFGRGGYEINGFGHNYGPESATVGCGSTVQRTLESVAADLVR